ncbi:HD-GYP domain-containing protein [Shewanella sp. 10N.7]|uniref:HD-GYP domain-containing protein n=1 Tax=Shewanella sp. 10N.7 TaxID=2885093 RepID=UPI001E547977|nr:HD-GYP domain-containing protein [Shewanella sp. 10N.7]MCC4834721.1 HD-GYP domain-containing protein [Shewanella sp. 10N.7]
MDKRTLYQLINTLSAAIEARDLYTSVHQNKVSNIARIIAQELQLSKEKIENIRLAGMLHDIGKLGIPTSILSKAGRLRKEEFDLIKQHSLIGEEILKHIDFSFPLSTIVRQHHERINGSGYPDGLKGNDILLEARIIAVADVFDSMTSSRAYRGALGMSAAMDELNKGSGILYDSEVVDACYKLYKNNKINDLNSNAIWGGHRLVK